MIESACGCKAHGRHQRPFFFLGIKWESMFTYLMNKNCKGIHTDNNNCSYGSLEFLLSIAPSSTPKRKRQFPSGCGIGVPRQTELSGACSCEFPDISPGSPRGRNEAITDMTVKDCPLPVKLGSNDPMSICPSHGEFTLLVCISINCDAYTCDANYLVDVGSRAQVNNVDGQAGLHPRQISTCDVMSELKLF